MPEYPGIQGVVVGRLDQHQATRREQGSRFGQHLVGTPDVLDQVEYEDEVEFFRTLELLDGAEEVTMSRLLGGSLGAGVEIDDLRCRHPRIDRFHGIEQPAGPSPYVQGGELLPGNLSSNCAKYPAVERLLYSLHQPGRARGNK